MGSSRFERQYRDRSASLARPCVFWTTEGVEVDGAKWFAGVDWGTRTHQACVLDWSGKAVGERAFAHGGEGLSALSDWLASFADGDAGAVGVALETPRGPVTESLMERGFAVHSINPKQLDRFRDRHSPAGAKDDRRDAWVLASALRTDPHCLRRLTAAAAEVVELRERTRLAGELTRERTRLANRMREQLWRYYPQFLDAVGGDVASAFALALWRRLPNPGAGRKARESTLNKLLKRHGIRRIDAETLRLRLRAPSAPLAPGSAVAAESHVRLVAKRLELANEQLSEARRRLDELLAGLASAPGAADEASGDAPGQPERHRDAAVLLSLPGVGATVAAALLSEAPDALRNRDYHALRCICGVAPVTRRSGRSLLVVRRLAAHDRLRDAAYHWARVAAQRDPVSKAKYQALRQRGHRHARALRSVADRLLNVACAMLRDGALFDPQRVGAPA